MLAEGEIVVELQGRRYHASSEKHPEFVRRAQGTWFQACVSVSTSQMFVRASDGCIMLQEEHIPQPVIDLFPEIWSYMLTGEWPRPLVSMSSIMKKMKAFEFLGVVDADTKALGDSHGNILFRSYLLQLPDDFNKRACCGPIDGNALLLGPGPTQFDAVGDATSQQLTAELGSVSLAFGTGSVHVKLSPSCRFVYATEHPLLRHKVMVSLVMRKYESNHRRYGTGFVLFVKVAPRRRAADARFRLSPVAHWPAFWFVASCRQVGGTALETVSTEVLPGGLSTMMDGTVAVISHPDNLRKARLALYPAKGSVVYAPPLLVNLVAPAPPQATTPPWSRGPSGKGNWPGKSGFKGPGVPLLKGQLETLPEEQRPRNPCVLTRHPHGRAPAQVWLVGCGPQLILVIHAVDGRVAVAQVKGLGGCFPECPRPRGKEVLWDVWCRAHDDPLESRTMRRRRTLRRRFAVPLCAEILTVLPREQEIALVCRLKPGDFPRLWRVPLDAESGKANMVVAFTSFSFDVKGIRKGHVKGKGKDHAMVTGHWIENEWFSHVNGKLPRDIVDSKAPHVCEIFGGISQQPLFDYQRWRLVDPHVKPVISHYFCDFVVGRDPSLSHAKGFHYPALETHYLGPSPGWECQLESWSVTAAANTA